MNIDPGMVQRIIMADDKVGALFNEVGIDTKKHAPLLNMVRELTVDSPNKNVLGIIDTQQISNLGNAIAPFMEAGDGNSSALTEVGGEHRANFVKALATVEPDKWEEILSSEEDAMPKKLVGALVEAGYSGNDATHTVTSFEQLKTLTSDGSGENDPKLGEKVAGLSAALHGLPEDADRDAITKFIASATDEDFKHMETLKQVSDEAAKILSQDGLGFKIGLGALAGGLGLASGGGFLPMILMGGIVGFFGGQINEFMKDTLGFDMKEAFNDVVDWGKNLLGLGKEDSPDQDGEPEEDADKSAPDAPEDSNPGNAETRPEVNIAKLRETLQAIPKEQIPEDNPELEALYEARNSEEHLEKLLVGDDKIDTAPLKDALEQLDTLYEAHSESSPKGPPPEQTPEPMTPMAGADLG